MLPAGPFMKTNPTRFAVLSSAVIALLAFSSQAQAKGAVCEHVQDELFEVDGMQDDWQSFKAVAYGQGSDAKLNFRCAYDGRNLYLMLRVFDQRLLRTKKASAGKEDHIRLQIGVGRAKAIVATVFPGSARIRHKISAPRYVQIEDSLQDRGFSVEVAIPLRKIPNWSASVPYLNAKVVFHDADPGKRAKKVVGLKGKMHFSDAASTYRAFMKQLRLRNRDIKLDKLVDVDPGDGPERVLVGGTVIGILGESFSYTQLPISSPADLLSSRVVDFDGSGRYMIVTELRQYGNGGSRDLVKVWSVGAKGVLSDVLTVETRKQRGDAVVENTWTLVPRGKHRGQRSKRKGRGVDLLVQAGVATGFSQENYREARAVDAKAILLPWAEQTSAVYFFEGPTAYGGEADSLQKK